MCKSSLFSFYKNGSLGMPDLKRTQVEGVFSVVSFDDLLSDVHNPLTSVLLNHPLSALCCKDTVANETQFQKNP